MFYPHSHTKAYSTGFFQHVIDILTPKHQHVSKGLQYPHLDPKLSNAFWKHPTIDYEITLTLKFRYVQYMGNHINTYFGQFNFQNLSVCVRQVQPLLTPSHNYLHYAPIPLYMVYASLGITKEFGTITKCL